MPRPVLVFDGDCSFCRMWIGYWQGLTGDRVEYAPYQTAAERFPEVPRTEFQKAVQYFQNGTRFSGAEAVFRLIGWPLPLWLYRNLPAFAAIAEWQYALVAAHRNAGYRVTRVLWGKRVERPSYVIA